MDLDLLKEIYADYSNALDRLEEAVNEDIQKGDIVIDGTIQRFEFTFEVAWKLLRALLKYYGVEVNSPRSAIKEAFRMDYINNGEDWIDMLEDRNKTSHIYHKSTALEIYEKIKNYHLQLLKDLLIESKKHVE